MANRYGKARVGTDIGSHPYFVCVCALFTFPHAAFVYLVAVHFGALGESAISVEVIPLAVDLEPLTGHHDAVFIKVVMVFAVFGGEPAGSSFAVYVNILPLAAVVLTPAACCAFVYDKLYEAAKDG